MRPQQVDKGFVLHPFYWNEVLYWETINDGRNVLDYNLKASPLSIIENKCIEIWWKKIV